MTLRRIGPAGVVAIAAILAFATTASAHARYKSSTPGKGEVVQTAPAKVDVYFTQDIQKVSGTYDLQIEKDRGPSVTAGPAVIDEADRSHLSVPLQANLTAGRYVVHWKNVSDDDGDPAEGAFSFYVQKAPNTVDLANDQQLELIGAEPSETPGADQTPAASASASTGTPVASASAGSSATPGTASPVATAVTTNGGSNDSHTARNVTIVVVAIIAILAIGGGVAYAVRGRMRP